MNYLFYLEPYAFLLRSNDKTVVYNTLNATYLICPDYPIVQLIIEQWQNPTNGYSVLLDKEMMENEVVRHFVEAVRELFSGDCIEYDGKFPKPYIFQPTLFLNSDIRVKDEEKKASLGNRVMENLNEVNLYLPATCELECPACTSYFHQINHCTVHSGDGLKTDDYRRLIRQFLMNGIKRINIFAGGNPNKNSYVRQLLPDMEKSKVDVHLYLDNTFLCSEYEELVQQTKCVLEVLVHAEGFGNQLTEDMREDETYMKNVVDNGTQIQVCGIIRQKEDAVNTAIRSGVGYTKELMQYLMQGVNDSEVAKAQLADETTDIFTGIPFDNDKDTPITMDDVNAYVATLSEQEQAQMQAYMSQMTEEQILQQFSQSLKAQTTEATFEGNKEKLGITNEDNPSEIDLYAASFEAKEKLEDIISDYNKKATDEGRDEDVINYTDYVGIMMSSVSTIITAISAVLIAFVAISLVVSSIMIGIITYISVLERTKEIGILRSIGASKKDVSRVFNAETLIEGFVSGALGIVITLILCIPANRIIENVTTIAGVAKLPVAGAVILVIISMVLTLIAGFVPAKMAAKKDPVVALRTE